MLLEVRGRQQTRRQVLMIAGSLPAAHALLHPRGAFARGEETEKLRSASLAQIDTVFRDATRAQRVPGVVAMAATDGGVIYEGAFGSRHLGQGPAMSRDTPEVSIPPPGKSPTPRTPPVSALPTGATMTVPFTACARNHPFSARISAQP
jgi:hypothetical protein